MDLKAGEQAETIDVTITPVWAPGIEGYVISELVFENFKDVDEEMLREGLRGRGIGSGVALLPNPPSKIKELIRDTALELYESDVEKARKLDETLSSLSSQVESTGNGRIRLTIRAGYRLLCE